MTTPRIRIKELRNIPARELLDNPKNFREHPKAQVAAVRALIDEIGYVDVLKGIDTEDGHVMLIDGHLRKDLDIDAILPVLILDLSEAEADLMLATFDHVTSKATVDGSRLDELLESVRDGRNEVVNALLADLGKLGEDDPEVKDLAVPTPPRMSWFIIGLPTVRWVEIAAEVEKLGARYEDDEDVILDTCANNG